MKNINAHFLVDKRSNKCANKCSTKRSNQRAGQTSVTKLLQHSALVGMLVASLSADTALAQLPDLSKIPNPFAPPPKPKPKQTPDEAASKKGYKLIKTLDNNVVSAAFNGAPIDVTGDGVVDIVGVCSGDSGLRLCIFGENEEGAVLNDIVADAGGDQLESLEIKNVIGTSPALEIILTVKGETPDEKFRKFLIYAAGSNGKLRSVLSTAQYEPKANKKIDVGNDAGDENKMELREILRDPNLVQYGDASPGWSLVDIDEDGTSELLVRRRPQIVAVPVEAGAMGSVKQGNKHVVRFLTGVREAVYTFDGLPETGRFVESHDDHLSDFLPAYTVLGVTADNAYLDPTAALLAGDDPSAKNAVITQGADRDMTTAWIENDEKGFGKGTWLEVKLDAERPIHMIRLVGSCAGDKKSYNDHNVIEKFTVSFGRRTASIDRGQLSKTQGAVKAAVDMPIKDRNWAKQTLIFFDGNDKAQTVRIMIDDVKRQGKSNQTCIAEVSVH